MASGPSLSLTELFEEGRNCNGILALITERILNPSVRLPEGIRVATRVSMVPGLGQCSWMIVVDGRHRLAPPGTHGAQNASDGTQILGEMLQVMSPKLDMGTPKGAELVQIAIVRQVLFDPAGPSLWPTMRATADGPRAICDRVMPVEQENGDIWAANIAKRLGAS